MTSTADRLVGDRASARRVLLTVSGDVPADLDEQIADGRRPRPDYVAMAEAFDADLLDFATADRLARRWVRLLRRAAGRTAVLAWVTFKLRKQYDVVVSDGEQVGIPYAALCRFFGRGASRHMMIVHVLSVGKKTMPVRALRLAPVIDRFVVYASSQRDFVTASFGVDPDRVLLSTFTVDVEFFAPDAVVPERSGLISSAGLERRDYPTMMRAVEGLDVDVVIAAASPWSKWADSSEGHEPPANVTIDRLDFVRLRQLYASSDLVVMPLADVDFQAGITTILEAMAMGRALVCTRTPGQTDTVEHDVNGVYVPIGDVEALHDTIVDLLADADARRRLGRAAREWVVEHASLERYAERLAGEVDELRQM